MTEKEIKEFMSEAKCTVISDSKLRILVEKIRMFPVDDAIEELAEVMVKVYMTAYSDGMEVKR